MEKKFCHELFLDALYRKGLNTNTFAIKSKISPGTIDKWRKVRNVKKRSLIEKIERILGVKYEDLCVPAEGQLTTNVRPVETSSYSAEYDHDKEWPLIGKTHGGPWVETITDAEYPGMSEERVKAPDGVKDPNGFALTVEGDSMEPDFPDGCRICVSPNTQPSPGQYAVVIAKTPMGNRESCFKKVLPGKTTDTIILRSLNTKYNDIILHKSNVLKILPVVAFEVTVRKVLI